MSALIETIVALSSPASEHSDSHGPLDRAIVRLSGPRAIELAATVFASKKERESRTVLSAAQGWRRIAGQVEWKSLRQSHSFEAAAYVMKAPRSYTREDVVELHFPALRWLVSGLIDALLRSGARLAQPGEFTRRAYENGRINLDQAKNIAALIQATTADEARAFAARTQQRVSHQQHTLRTEIEELLALVELGLDFAAEDVEVISLSEMSRRLDILRLKSLALNSGTSGRASSTPTPSITLSGEHKRLHTFLPRIVLAGPTNAGKSRLFNALLGRDAALVSATRHTTRDCVEAPLVLNPSTVKEAPALRALLIDTAGSGADINSNATALGEGIDWLRQASWQKSRAALRSADVLLIVLDGSSPADVDAIQQALQQARPAATFLIWSKADLGDALSKDIENKARQSESTFPFSISAELSISAHTGQGLAELRLCIYQTLQEISARVQEATLSAESAARLCAEQCAEALSHAAEAIQLCHGEDAVAVELREALQACWQAEGLHIRHDAITEGLLDRIFSQFCIGK